MKLWGRRSFFAETAILCSEVLYTILPFLLGGNERGKSHRTSFCPWFTLKEVNTINKCTLTKPKIDWSFSCLFWALDVIFSGTAVNVMQPRFQMWVCYKWINFTMWWFKWTDLRPSLGTTKGKLSIILVNFSHVKSNKISYSFLASHPFSPASGSVTNGWTLTFCFM